MKNVDVHESVFEFKLEKTIRDLLGYKPSDKMDIHFEALFNSRHSMSSVIFYFLKEAEKKNERH